MVDIGAIRDCIEGGLSGHKDRLFEYQTNLDFYRQDFASYPYRASEGVWAGSRYERHSGFMNRAVQVLSSMLYAREPARSLPEQEQANEFLARTYEQNFSQGLLQEADRLTYVTDQVAVQVVGTEDPAKPVRLELWDGSQFHAWTDPEDPTIPVAVVLKDKYDAQTRYRLWTADKIEYFLTKRADDTAGGRVARFVRSEPNPYVDLEGRGILPFAFFHCNYPVQDFYSGGPGDALRNVNDWLNYALTTTADDLRYFARPLLVAQAAQDLVLPTPLHPGDVIKLPPVKSDMADSPQLPDLKYVQADAAAITEAVWKDLQAYIDHSLQMHGIPASAIRMEQTSTQSGVALVAEQIPLVQHTQARTQPFTRYEEELAHTTLRVAAAHLRNNGLPAEFLEAAAREFRLTLRWPSFWEDNFPGQDRDQLDQWLLDQRLTSPVRLAMKRFGLTEPEAWQYLAGVAEDFQKLEAMGIKPVLPVQNPTGGQN